MFLKKLYTQIVTNSISLLILMQFSNFRYFRGGYLVVPDTVEFWCGRSDRLHDRIRFRKPLPQETPDEKVTHTGLDGWLYEYLSP
ncbi:pyridoxine-5'-phosphate oxidase [Trichonephila clavipes]|nr:pyridoxine-5'-phosphate oxidase [Trichonephila clavipes]